MRAKTRWVKDKVGYIVTKKDDLIFVYDTRGVVVSKFPASGIVSDDC